jgi:hypothetical protein
MLRPLIVSLFSLVAVPVAAADDAPTSTTATSTSAANRATQSEEAPATKHRAKLHRAKQAEKDAAEKEAPATKVTGDDGKADAAAAGGGAAQGGGDVKMSGESILGNEDAPKSLVIVPWKSSQLGDMPSVSRLLDSGTQPVDKDVFMRELAYYEYRSSSK